MKKKEIGSTFSDELKAAGLLGLPFSWGTDGEIQFGSSMQQDQRDAVLAVYAAHDPLKSAAPVLSPLALKIDAALASPLVSQPLKDVLIEIRKSG